MAKSPFQDIVPPEKKSIQRITRPSRIPEQRIPDRIEQSDFFRKTTQPVNRQFEQNEQYESEEVEQTSESIHIKRVRQNPQPELYEEDARQPASTRFNDREQYARHLEETQLEAPVEPREPVAPRFVPGTTYQSVSRPVQRAQPPRFRPTQEPRYERSETEDQNAEQEQPRFIPPQRTRSGASKKSRRRFPWMLIVILLLALAAVAGTVIFMSRTAGAKVSVTPRTQQISVDSTFTASKTSTSTPAALQFQTITISKDGKMEVPASGTEQADVKASGTIVIYNDYSTAEQKLIANTRFETPEGLIFRISNPVTVPGKSGTTPGSIEAIVTADKTGADYNVGLKDFSIPGFKGDAKYEKIYARAKVAIGGGFSGTRAKVNTADVTTAQTKIKDELKAALVAQAQNAIPSDYVMPTNSYYIEYEDLPQTQSSSGGALIAQRATLHGIIFMKSQLAAQLSQKANGTVDPSQTDILGTANLLFSTKAASSTAKVWDLSNLNFNLIGTTTLVSSVDTTTLQKDLAGKPRKNLNAILAGYSSIAKADLTMWPFWKTVFPNDASRNPSCSLKT